jgi:hypothetical protein
VEGVDKPVYQGGVLVGYVREYSDQLLVTLLKAHRPEKFRDNVAFGALAHSLGARADVAEATDQLNRHQIDRLAALTSKLLNGSSKVGILGGARLATTVVPPVRPG